MSTRIENAMTIDGMTTRDGLMIIDLFIQRSLEQGSSARFAEFGAWKGRVACLLAQNAGQSGWVDVVEQSNYVEAEKIRLFSERFTIHQNKSEFFTQELLPTVLNGDLLGATHHDASHFFQNVAVELENTAPFMDPRGVIILDDFNDHFSQVRAAYYYLRYVKHFPFELLLIGFNKAVLVHEGRWQQNEQFILSEFLDIAEDEYGSLLRLARTDNDPRSRCFYVSPRQGQSDEKYYGTSFFGHVFYQKSN